MERSVVVKVKKLEHFDFIFVFLLMRSLQAAGADFESFPSP